VGSPVEKLVMLKSTYICKGMGPSHTLPTDLTRSYPMQTLLNDSE